MPSCAGLNSTCTSHGNSGRVSHSHILGERFVLHVHRARHWGEELLGDSFFQSHITMYHLHLPSAMIISEKPLLSFDGGEPMWATCPPQVPVVLVEQQLQQALQPACMELIHISDPGIPWILLKHNVLSCEREISWNFYIFLYPFSSFLMYSLSSIMHDAQQTLCFPSYPTLMHCHHPRPHLPQNILHFWKPFMTLQDLPSYHILSTCQVTWKCKLG